MAGASLTPSPTIATLSWPASLRMALTLSSGMRLPQASSRPTSFPTASATLWSSPEIMIIRVIPRPRNASSVAFAAARGVSSKPIAPRSRVSERTPIVVRPRSRMDSIASDSSALSAGTPSCPNISSFPIHTRSPPTSAVIPLPVKLSRLVASGSASSPSRCLPSLTIACARG